MIWHHVIYEDLKGKQKDKAFRTKGEMYAFIERNNIRGYLIIEHEL